MINVCIVGCGAMSKVYTKDISKLSTVILVDDGFLVHRKV